MKAVIAFPLLAALLAQAALAQTRPAAVLSAPAASTQSSAGKSVNELAARLKAMREEKADRSKVAHFDLSRELKEKPADFTLFGDASPTHYTVLKRLRQAGNDPQIAGVLVSLHGDEMKLSHAHELRDALLEISAKGKPTFVYADRYDSSGYILATGAQNVCILPGGELLIPGVAIETVFARGLLDKLGVQPDMLQVGEYKGASEAFMRTSSSDEFRGEMRQLVDALYGQMVSEIAKRRSISEKRVRDAIDQAWIPADTAKDLGLVDHLVDIDALRDLMASKIGKKVELLPGYGIEKERDVDFSNPFALLQLFTKKAEQPESPCVALVYVDGMIVEGEGSEGLFSASSAADGLIRRAMRIAQRDPNVKAIVIRIDSPGGSALASEAAWQAIRRVAKEKPVVVSIGAMAASGGYYIACAGDRIFADPSSIVGSIGVVGGKVSLNGLYQKLGLNAEMYSRGANAGMFSSSEPFTDSQRILVGRLMRQTYDQFVNRVMQTRKGRIADVDKVARGRIFAGIRAKELGLVDEIGGLNAALRDAAVKGALNPDKMEVRVLPAPRSLTDLLGEKEQVAAPLGMGSHMPLELSFLPATLRDLAAMQWSAMTQMSTGRVMLVPPAMMRLR